jgi:penicillin-binding protein 2
MANVMAAIARDGRLMGPMLVLEGRSERAVRDLPLPAGALGVVRQGMKSVVGDPEGTGYKAFHGPGLERLGVDVCGKTGTAQVPEQRLEHDQPGRGKAGEIVREGKMAWFAGFAPAERPRIAFAVVVEYVTEGTGGSNAGPVARDLVRWCKDLGYLSD